MFVAVVSKTEIQKRQEERGNLSGDVSGELGKPGVHNNQVFALKNPASQGAGHTERQHHLRLVENAVSGAPAVSKSASATEQGRQVDHKHSAA